MKHAVPGLSLRFPMTFWGLLQVGRLSSPCKTQMLQSRPDAKAKGHTKPSEVDDEYLRICVQRFLQFERLKLCLKRRAKKDFAYFYQCLFTIQLSPVKNYYFTLWIGLFCSLQLDSGMKFHPLQLWVKCPWSSLRTEKIDFAYRCRFAQRLLERQLWCECGNLEKTEAVKRAFACLPTVLLLQNCIRAAQFCMVDSRK